jgi:inorganic pyrophosphatase
MRIDAISIGKNPPDDVNVIIEVPVGGEPIKYEMDKDAGTLVVDRFLYTAMRYPGNYGFIPHTLSDDGDPCDVLVANTRAIVPGAVISVRPVGVLLMEDEAGGDEKIIAVPTLEADPALRQGHQLHRPAGNHAAADRALLRALQGSRARQVGEGAALGRCRRGPQADRRGHRAREEEVIGKRPQGFRQCAVHSESSAISYCC